MNKNPLNLTTKIIIFHCLKFQPVLEAKRCYKNKVIKGVLIAIYLVLWFESYEWLVGIDRLSFFLSQWGLRVATVENEIKFVPIQVNELILTSSPTKQSEIYKSFKKIWQN